MDKKIEKVAPKPESKVAINDEMTMEDDEEEEEKVAEKK